jgi:hypothetical protein
VQIDVYECKEINGDSDENSDEDSKDEEKIFSESPIDMHCID